jgi:5'-deoxynucleotidase
MNNFYALLNRMKYIERWCLMRNSAKENLMEHSSQVAIIAHALALIKNKMFGGTVDANKVAVLALYHDASEVITGDMPTPIKYNNDKLKEAYKEMESLAEDKLLDLLPKELLGDYAGLIKPNNNSEEYKNCKIRR